MAKRLTDTTKWFNPSFRKLPHKYKLLYLYLFDICDNAGVSHLDLELASDVIGDSFEMEELKAVLGQRIAFITNEKVIIKNYIAFQNGDIFDSDSRVAKSIRNLLNSHGVLERYRAGEFGVVNGAVCN